MRPLGSTTPGWVILLLLLTVIGWLIALTMTSRRYEIDIPFRHDLHERWRRLNRRVWLLGISGVAIALGSGLAGFDRAPLFLALSAVALVLWLVNHWANAPGVVLSRDQLLLTRVHPALAASLARRMEPSRA